MSIPKTLSAAVMSLALLTSLPAGAASQTAASKAAAPATVHTANAPASAYPMRGMSMKQVRKQYGQPHSMRQSAGKVRKHWPRITVWNYGKFSVYFERTRVLHTVVH